MKIHRVVIGALLLFSAAGAEAYPLEDWWRTGITRLKGYFLMLQTPSGQFYLPIGARLTPVWVKLRLEGSGAGLPPPDAALSAELRAALGQCAPNCGAAVLDITDPAHLRYGAYNATSSFMPASMGKVLVAAAVLQCLADIYPGDARAREQVLRETMITADEFIVPDDHEVPFWHDQEQRIEVRPLALGDRANLWSFMDFMLSASSNAAGSMVQKQILLMKHFGRRYPPTDAEAEAFISRSSPGQLAALFSRTMYATMSRNGINPALLMQASFFTKEGKRRVPSRGSTTTPQEAVRFLLRVEEGRLIDPFSSLELKRLLYATQRRVRYASTHKLENAAVYYKAGSQFRCGGGPCVDYQGTLVNIMNVMGIVEDPVVNPQRAYIFSLSTNVLRRNAEELHREIGGEIQAMMERRHPAPAPTREPLPSSPPN